ncbi:thioredoxin [Sulfolobales archaeon HS-7]|nr:thioredoxin [Sulfolobales archaeon HS-7]
MEIEIFTHSKCSECAILLSMLKEEGLIDKIKLVNTEQYPFIAFERGVLSTPSVFINGKLIWSGKVNFDELKEVIIKGTVHTNTVTIEEAIQKMEEGIFDSFAASCWLYVSGNLLSLLEQKDFVLAITGLASDPQGNKKYEEIVKYVKEHSNEIFEKWKPSLIRNIVTNFVRELYWLYSVPLGAYDIKRLYPLEIFSHWMMISSGAVGRVGLRIYPLSDTIVMKRIKDAYQYLFDNYDEIWNRVISSEKLTAELNSRITQ